MKILKNKKNAFLSYVSRITLPKNQIPSSKTVVSSSRTETHTDRQTHTKVNTEGTLSGFQDFFLQPITKDRLNTLICCISNMKEKVHLNQLASILRNGYGITNNCPRP